MIQRLIQKIEPALIRLYLQISLPPPPNLRGDRVVEYAWIAANVPSGPGQALDFGCGNGHLSLLAIQRGFKVIALDLTCVGFHYVSPDLQFNQKDLFDAQLQPSSMDLIINCSAIEHVGLGRYGDRGGSRGDLEAMKLLRNLLKPTGVMLLTIPVGKDATFAPLHRVYGPERLPRLLEGFTIAKEKYWIKDEQNRWVEIGKERALNQSVSKTYYGLGGLILQPVTQRKAEA